ncbi:MAG: PocR ligand-binding domain-containing protein [Spirochaetes bacterium]|nr:PocR ligand-binding domain-containing protein [Spirochaetota bacterium]
MQDNDQKKILLVEDEVLIALAEKTVLEKYSYNVTIVNCGEDAVKFINGSEKIDLILMDIDLGEGLDGTETAKIILDKYEIPVVFLSSHTDPEVVGRTEKITSYGYVVKNTGITVLDASIKMAFKLFNSRQQLYEKQNEIEAANEELESAIEELEVTNEELVTSNIQYERLQSELIESRNHLKKSEAILRDKLDIILNPETDIDDIDLSKFINIDKITGLLENFTSITGMVTAVLDINGRVLVSTGWQDICKNYHRVNCETAVNCTESDCYLAQNLKKGEFVDYKCKNGLWDVVTPFYIGNKHAGNIFTGQFFYTEDIIDEGFFINQAERHGFSKKPYMEALKKVPRYDHSTIEYLMKFLVGLFTIISESSYSNILLAKETEELKKTREKIKESESRFRYILDTIPQRVFWKDINGIYLGGNRLFAESAGLKEPDDIIGKTDSDFPWSENDISAYRADDNFVIQNAEPRLHIIEEVQSADGNRIWAETNKFPLFDGEGNVYGMLGVYDDISERKLNQEITENLLLEKTLLLKEIHHRIKNNLFSIESMLSLHSDSLANQESKNIILDAAGRVKSIRIVYEKLLMTSEYRFINAGNYIEDLVKAIVNTYDDSSKYSIQFKIDNFEINIKTLFPLGLIINELITNSMKYAFMEMDRKSIKIRLKKKSDKVSLTVSDNGKGLPADFNMEKSDGFGIRLIKMLTQQLKGRFTLTTGNGTTVRIDFKFDL